VDEFNRILMGSSLEEVKLTFGSRALAIKDDAIEAPAENFVKCVSRRDDIAWAHVRGEAGLFAAGRDHGDFNKSGILVEQARC
jgi:hypothetical protein